MLRLPAPFLASVLSTYDTAAVIYGLYLVVFEAKREEQRFFYFFLIFFIYISPSSVKKQNVPNCDS